VYEHSKDVLDALHLVSGTGDEETRSVEYFLARPRLEPVLNAGMRDQHPTQTVTGIPPCLKPEVCLALESGEHFSANSRLYSPAIVLFRAFIIRLGRLPSFSKVSAQ